MKLGHIRTENWSWIHCFALKEAKICINRWMENEWHPRRRKLPVILLQQVRESTPVSWNPINCVIDGWQLPEQLASILNDVIWISVGTP
jgi:hypothetical protein